MNSLRGRYNQYDRKKRWTRAGLGQFWAESQESRVQVRVIDIRVQVLKNKDSSPTPLEFAININDRVGKLYTRDSNPQDLLQSLIWINNKLISSSK